MSLERLWAGWRTEYVSSAVDAGGDDDHDSCVFCRILGSDLSDEVTKVVWRGAGLVALLNAYPYTSGHVMIVPTRHVGEVEDLDDEEGAAVWAAVTAGVRALKAAYHPEGINVGANLGRAAGAGVPGHFHVHLLPRWNGDTNFMTSVAEVRVLPESLDASWSKLRSAWPAGDA